MLLPLLLSRRWFPRMLLRTAGPASRGGFGSAHVALRRARAGRRSQCADVVDHLPTLLVGRQLGVTRHLPPALGDLPVQRAVGLPTRLLGAEVRRHRVEVLRARAVAATGLAVAVHALGEVERTPRLDRRFVGGHWVLPAA